MLPNIFLRGIMRVIIICNLARQVLVLLASFNEGDRKETENAMSFLFLFLFIFLPETEDIITLLR